MMPLQIFEKHPAADAYRVGGFYSPYCLVSTDKRFSDAELAAEYWMQHEELGKAVDRAYPHYESDATELELARIYVLESFCSLPHFDA